MKTILRNTAVYGLALFFLSQIDAGLIVSGGFTTYVLGGFVLCLLFMILKPILNILSLPLNIITLGLFSFLTNTIILYLATDFVPQIKISSFVFHGISTSWIKISELSFDGFLAYVASAVLLSLIVGVISWLTKR